MPLNFAYTQVSYHPSLWSGVSLFLEFGESPTGKLVSKQGRRGNKARHIRQLLIMTEEESERRGGGALGVEKTARRLPLSHTRKKQRKRKYGEKDGGANMGK